MAKQLLEVGQRVWFELESTFFRSANSERNVYEYEIVESNNSSAYAVSVDCLEKYKKDMKGNSFLKHRIEQSTYRVKRGLGDSFSLWVTKEAFEKNVQYNKDMIEARKKAHTLIDSMPLSKLNDLLEQFEPKNKAK